MFANKSTFVKYVVVDTGENGMYVKTHMMIEAILLKEITFEHGQKTVRVPKDTVVMVNVVYGYAVYKEEGFVANFTVYGDEYRVKT